MITIRADYRRWLIVYSKDKNKCTRDIADKNAWKRGLSTIHCLQIQHIFKNRIMHLSKGRRAQP